MEERIIDLIAEISKLNKNISRIANVLEKENKHHTNCTYQNTELGEVIISNDTAVLTSVLQNVADAING